MPFVERLEAEFAATIDKKSTLIIPFIGILGGLTPAASVCMLLAIGMSRRWVNGAVAFFIGGFMAMALVPEPYAVFERQPTNIRNEISVSTIVAGAFGVIFVLLLATSVVRLIWLVYKRPKVDRAAYFLIGWLTLECLATFAMTPFPAVRRMLGVWVVTMLICGQLLAIQETSSALRHLLNRTARFGVGLGVLFATTDFRDGLDEKHAVTDCVNWIQRQPDGNERIWFTGHWGFQYYAEREGCRAVFPEESVLQDGDWLICPDPLVRPYGQSLVIDPEQLTPRSVIEWHSVWPLRTSPDFYDGYQPIRHHEGYRVRATIYRVNSTFQAQSP